MRGHIHDFDIALNDPDGIYPADAHEAISGLDPLPTVTDRHFPNLSFAMTPFN